MENSLCQGPVLSALLGRDGPEVGDLRVEEKEPPDPQLQGQGSFLFQGLPVVEEDEVGAGLPAHVGEVPGAEVGGEKDRRLQPPPQLAELLLGDGVPYPLVAGRKKSSRARRRQRTSRRAPYWAMTSSSRRRRELPEMAEVR